MVVVVALMSLDICSIVVAQAYPRHPPLCPSKNGPNLNNFQTKERT